MDDCRNPITALLILPVPPIHTSSPDRQCGGCAIGTVAISISKLGVVSHPILFYRPGLKLENTYRL